MHEVRKSKSARSEPQTVCPKDGGSLYVRYDFKPYIGKLKPEQLSASQWQHVALPRSSSRRDASHARRRPDPHGPKAARIPNLFIKDEGQNPTGSFKARGLSAAVTMCKFYGIKKIAVPSAGNAASALAAYAAAAGIEAHIFMPKDVPEANRIECIVYGAKLTLVDGLISDCAKIVNERKKDEGWFDISSLKEPFRVEGKKTMGYELAEQLGWKLARRDFLSHRRRRRPDRNVESLRRKWKLLGWIGKERPKMIAVQVRGLRADSHGRGMRTNHISEFWQNAHTVAAGLRVPESVCRLHHPGYFEIQRRHRHCRQRTTKSSSVFDLGGERRRFRGAGRRRSAGRLSQAACVRFPETEDRVVLFNTGSGLKYIDVIAEYLERSGASPGLNQSGR